MNYFAMYYTITTLQKAFRQKSPIIYDKVPSLWGSSKSSICHSFCVCKLTKNALSPWKANHFGIYNLDLHISSNQGWKVVDRARHSISTFRIGVAMKKSSALQRCCAAQAGTIPGQSSAECETEISYNKGRQAVVRMLGKLKYTLGQIWRQHPEIKYFFKVWSNEPFFFGHCRPFKNWFETFCSENVGRLVPMWGVKLILVWK